MKRRNHTERRGVALLLILTLLAMFAVSVLAFMTITSNMADTAQNAAKAERYLPPTAKEDVNAALRNVLIGSDNERNPIGPFGVLENMYGDWRNVANNDDASFEAYLTFFPEYGFATVTPYRLDDNDAYDWEFTKALFEHSGGVLTILGGKTPNGASDAWENDWSERVEGSSAFVLQKVITNPVGRLYKTSSVGVAGGSQDYSQDHYSASSVRSDYCDYWHLRVELTDDWKAFAEKHGGADIAVTARLNRPAFGGTGAGGFTPGDSKDAQITTEMVDDDLKDYLESQYGFRSPSFLQIPFAFWGNAAAPDLVEGDNKFRSFASHLRGGVYESDDIDATWSGWRYGAVPRLNPSYTAPDARSLFLAYYAGPVRPTLGGGIPDITPSFHRRSLFDALIRGNFLQVYRDAYANANVDVNVNSALVALIRKLTPRPLPLDHLKFDGGNDRLRYGNVQTPEDLAEELALYNNQALDVDNDGDGFREGVWVPSGLPVRVDENGTPYATMYSYTVLDLDGRMNVNVAGAWDQLPLNGENPYSSLADLARAAYKDYGADYLSGASEDVVKGNVFSLQDSNLFAWRNDRDVALRDGRTGDYPQDVEARERIKTGDGIEEQARTLQRGDGFGVANVGLYDYFENVLPNADAQFIEKVAESLLWRRYSDRLAGNRANNVVREDAGAGGLAGMQPGYRHRDADGNEFSGENDDALNSRNVLFNLTNSMAIVNREDSNEDMIYPWRGKTTVSGNQEVPAIFDFANAALRSYDPLGNQLFTYAPRYTRNPYLAAQNASAWEDSPYTIPMLEALLRPYDADTPNLPTQLKNDMRWDELDADAQANLRATATTLSSDVPAPSMVFPDGAARDGELPGGSYGIEGLIRRCVYTELNKVFKAKGIYVDEDNDGLNDLTQYYDGDANINPQVFDRKVDEITAYLVSLLPPELTAGQKIDLNALSQKSYWLDVEYDANGNLVVNPTVEYTVNNATKKHDFVAKHATHNIGLIKRMERARGLYIVVMALLYEDMNAGTLYNLDGQPPKWGDYIEGAFDLSKFNGPANEKKKDLVAKELTATRIAQWCVNTIDFSDPDATMTPFYFDPTPFDGWWTRNNDWIDVKVDAGAYSYNPWKVGMTDSYVDAQGQTVEFTHQGWPAVDATLAPEDQVPNWDAVAQYATVPFLFAPELGTPTELMNAFFLDALMNSVDAKNDTKSPYRQWNGAAGENLDKFGNELIAEWLGREIKSLDDQTSDLGFRVLWGMERPDLLLTETLNFHDLGIADTDKESDVPADDIATVSETEDNDDQEDFDQVKRPVGSTYLELYCAANPHVPQSPELYDYDANTKTWRLRVSKRTPVYKDSLENELETPVWRVAISESRDPRGLNWKSGMSDDDKKNAASNPSAVYRKPKNSVLDWLSDNKEFAFFSMQTRQFRNLPMKGDGPHAVNSIADLDLFRGVEDDEAKGPNTIDSAADDYVQLLEDWKPFNLRSSHVLGSAVAEEEEEAGVVRKEGKCDNAWSLREIELDRIVWFAHAEGDFVDGAQADETTQQLGNAGKYPDALRTFVNAADEAVYLAPNEYLVVGPEKSRPIGSLAFNMQPGEDEDKRFGVAPSNPASWIKIDNGRHGVRVRVDVSGNKTVYETTTPTAADAQNLYDAAKPTANYKYMVAVSNIGRRGLNISEPLWTAHGLDPYYPKDKQGEKLNPSEVDENGKIDVRDVPFEMPTEWGERDDEGDFYEKTVANYPIVQDKLFGVGTVPAYKTAFLQRVADPNRPYHPLMNPYITVDWNAMDLTVYTGESQEINDEREQENESFAKDSEFKEDNNRIKLANNLDVLNVANDAFVDYVDAFSSRQWGNANQKMFSPTWDGDAWKPRTRPNVWARAFKKAAGDDAGLEKAQELPEADSGECLAMRYAPTHTLGSYNDRGPLGLWAKTVDANGNDTANFTPSLGAQSWYKNLNQSYRTLGGQFLGTPRVPFEHLLWNDAPYSAPFELTLVPASSPGRFGLEFVRAKGHIDLTALYEVKNESNKENPKVDEGTSLGFDGAFGFDEWKGGGAGPGGGNKYGKLGPYLNFFASSNTPGETLNLCKALELVYTPSRFYGTKRLANLNREPLADEKADATFNEQYEAFGDSGYDLGSWSRNWGRNDANGDYHTLTPALRSARREPGKVNLNTVSKPVWEALLGASEWRTDWDERTDPNGRGVDPGYYVFQPAQTTSLWTQLTGENPPVPTFSTLAANSYLDASQGPLFDNIASGDRNVTDNGQTVYEYIDEEGNLQTTTDLDWLQGNVSSYWPKRSTEGVRNNLFEATAEMQRLSGTTTNRSNVFAVWTTVGYFEVERCNPGVNMPNVDPDGETITLEQLINPNYKWYHYYQAIYPDGYTYGKELGSEFGETKRRRGFAIIDRSIPVDFRRGQSANYQDAILLQRVLD